MDFQRAFELIPAFAHQPIAVIDDQMLDRYRWGEAKHISQETPLSSERLTAWFQVPA